MVATNRVGTIAILGGALALAGLMAYTLVGVGSDAPRFARRSPAPTPEVVAIFPEASDWREFRQGIVACERNGLLRIVSEGAESVTVQTPRYSRIVRFDWAPAQGELQTRREVRRRLESPTPPLAFVGSSNSALTAALAGELHDAVGRKPDAPVLLIPWATAVQAAPAEGKKAEPLLAIHPGCSFRFCPNNRREAELVVDCLAKREADRPSRVFVVVDPADPYSTDLAGCFEAAIEAVAPKVEIVAFRDVVAHSGPDDQPTSEDFAWARGVADALPKSSVERPAWIVLPLQAEPSRRLLRALRATLRTALPRDAPRVDVLCGDGVGLESIGEFAGGRFLSVWCASAASDPTPPPNAALDTNVPTEIVAAIAASLDRKAPPSRAALRAALAGLDLPADHAPGLNRSLAFTPQGERRGDDLGRVFHAGPARAEVLSFARDRSGGWPEPVTIRLPPIEVRQ